MSSNIFIYLFEPYRIHLITYTHSPSDSCKKVMYFLLFDLIFTSLNLSKYICFPGYEEHPVLKNCCWFCIAYTLLYTFPIMIQKALPTLGLNSYYSSPCQLYSNLHEPFSVSLTSYLFCLHHVFAGVFPLLKKPSFPSENSGLSSNSSRPRSSALSFVKSLYTPYPPVSSKNYSLICSYNHSSHLL